MWGWTKSSTHRVPHPSMSPLYLHLGQIADCRRARFWLGYRSRRLGFPPKMRITLSGARGFYCRSCLTGERFLFTKSRRFPPIISGRIKTGTWQNQRGLYPKDLLNDPPLRTYLFLEFIPSIPLQFNHVFVSHTPQNLQLSKGHLFQLRIRYEICDRDYLQGMPRPAWTALFDEVHG